MKHALVFSAFLIFQPASAYSQSDSTWFDFWLGDWSLTWTGPDGKEVHGENTITKIHGGKVILEEFSSPSQSYTGSSYSVFNPRRKEWKQTWVDSEGGYITLNGRKDGDMRIFETTEKMPQGNDLLQYRMVFHSITPRGFVWEWQSSADNKTWKTNWKILYTKKT